MKETDFDILDHSPFFDHWRIHSSDFMDYERNIKRTLRRNRSMLVCLYCERKFKLKRRDKKESWTSCQKRDFLLLLDFLRRKNEKEKKSEICGKGEKREERREGIEERREERGEKREEKIREQNFSSSFHQRYFQPVFVFVSRFQQRAFCFEK